MRDKRHAAKRGDGNSRSAVGTAATRIEKVRRTGGGRMSREGERGSEENSWREEGLGFCEEHENTKQSCLFPNFKKCHCRIVFFFKKNK